MRENHGYTNAFNYLVSCVCDGDKEETCKIYENNLQAKQRTIERFFDPIMPIRPKEEEVIDWETLMIEKFLPISAVVDETHRSFQNSTCNIGKETMRITVL